MLTKGGKAARYKSDFRGGKSTSPPLSKIEGRWGVPSLNFYKVISHLNYNFYLYINSKDYLKVRTL